MVNSLPHPLSILSRDALRLLAALIDQARRQRKLSQGELAARAGLSRTTLQHILHGEPTVAIGAYFEVAVLVGVPLFSPNQHEVTRLQAHAQEIVALLPRRVRGNAADGGSDDDF